MAVCLTAAKFKPLIFPVSRFALSNVANIASLSLSESESESESLSQSVCLGIEPRPGLMTRYLLLFDNFCFVFGGGALSDERVGLSFVRVCQL
jgi:hypothetical protein